MSTTTTLHRLLGLLPNLIAAIILLQTLFFKFSGAPESVYIFRTLGMEPVGRVGSGVAELVAAILLLWPGRSWLGALLALGVMAGAIMSHLSVLGIEVQGDGGLLFMLALTVALLSAFILFREREQLVAFWTSLRKRVQHRNA